MRPVGQATAEGVPERSGTRIERHLLIRAGSLTQSSPPLPLSMAGDRMADLMLPRKPIPIPVNRRPSSFR